MRFVPYGQQVRDAETDAFKGIAGTAFSIRASDAGCVSLTWVEHYGAKCDVTIALAASRFRDTLKSKKLPKKGYFAIGQAGETRTTAAQYGKQIRLVHAPDGPNTGHVELRRFSDDDRRLLDALAREVYSEHVPVSDMKLVP